MTNADTNANDAQDFNRLTRFLIFCAGADKKLLRQCPNSDLVKVQGVGGVVAATGILAFFSGSYAFHTVFSPKESLIANAEAASSGPAIYALIGALIFGIMWSLIIFNLDRFIVAASGPGDGTEKITGQEFVSALPRLLMAIFIGLILSKPLEIKIMETEIKAALSDAQQKKYDEYREATDRRFAEGRQRLDSERARVLQKLNEMEASINKLKAEISAAEVSLEQEMQGKNGGRRGDGKIAAGLRTLIADKKARLAQEEANLGPQTESLRKEAADLQVRIDTLLEEKQNAYQTDLKNAQRDDGLMRRIQLAHEVSPWASNLLTMLLIVIEVAPIFFKLMLIAGPYEYFIENEKRLAFARRGIDVLNTLQETGLAGSGDPLHVKKATYAEAAAMTAREVGKWRVESNLTSLALSAHEQAVGEEIRANPAKYIEGNTPVRPA